MAFDEALAERIRKALASRTDVEEKRMFGGIAFMVAGRMCCGVHRDRMILRLPVDQADGLLQRRKVREFDIQSRPIRGFVMVDPAGCTTPAQIGGWLQPAIAHALATARASAPGQGPMSRARTPARERAAGRQPKLRAR